MVMTAPAGFNPANDEHYGLSEEDEFRLREVTKAAHAIGNLLEAADEQIIDVIEMAEIAAMFRPLSYSLDSITKAAKFVCPKRAA